MKGTIFFSLSMVAVALALVLGAGQLNQAKAVPSAGDEFYSNWLPSGTGNMFGYDGAHNIAGTLDRDRDYPSPEFRDYEQTPSTYHP